MNENSKTENNNPKPLKNSLMLPRLNNLTKENTKFNKNIDLKNNILNSLIKLKDDLTADIVDINILPFLFFISRD